MVMSSPGVTPKPRLVQIWIRAGKEVWCGRALTETKKQSPNTGTRAINTLHK